MHAEAVAFPCRRGLKVVSHSVHLRDVLVKKIVLGLLLLIAWAVGLNSIGITPAFIVFGPALPPAWCQTACSLDIIGSERDQA